MRFLQDSDYLRLIKDNVLDQILENDYDLLLDVETSSILEMSGYIGIRYDRNSIFAVINDYDAAIAYAFESRVKYIEPDFATGTNYSIGNRVDFTDGFIYECIQATTGTEDPTDPLFWTQIQESELLYSVIDENGATAGLKPDLNPLVYQLGDTRNQLIVETLIDIVLYKISKRINPRNIPQLRVDAYDNAKIMLDQLNKGEIMGFDLPENSDNEGFSPTIVSGNSTTKFSTFY